MRKLSEWIQGVSTGKVVLITLAVFLAFTSFVMPGQAAKAREYTGGAGSIDTDFYYTPAELFEIAEAYGEEGRAAYVQTRWTFDLVLPLVYTAFLTVGVGYLLNKGFSHQGGWRLLNLVPVAGMLFDYLENAAATVVMNAFPEQPLGFARLASIATPVKWVLIGDAFLLLLIGLVAWGVRTRKRKKGLISA